MPTTADFDLRPIVWKWFQEKKRRLGVIGKDLTEGQLKTIDVSKTKEREFYKTFFAQTYNRPKKKRPIRCDADDYDSDGEFEIIE